MQTVNIAEKFGKFADQWSPRVIAQINDFHVKIAKIEGEFVWHSHPDTDELFIVNKGAMVIHLRDREIPLKAGEMFVVPKGVEHKPVADGECEIVMIEPAGTLNTGDATDDRLVEEPPWI